MRDQVRRFLIEHKYLLDKPLEEITEKDIQKLYSDANKEEFFDEDAFCTGEMTQILLKRFNPLDYLTSIPDSYLAGSHITEFKVPDNIKTIGAGAFYGCNSLLKVEIPESVSEIRMYAFSDCEKLKVLFIKNRYLTMDETIFENTKHIAKIYYDGKKDDWDLVWPYNPPAIWIECTDEILGPYI